MRRLLALVAAAALLAGCGSDEKPRTTGTSGSGSPTTATTSTTTTATATTTALVPLVADGYSVQLPGPSTASQQQATSEVGVIGFTLYSARDGAGGTFAVAMTAYPANAVLNLDGAVDGLANALGGRVLTNRKVRFRGHPARAVRIAISSDGTDSTVFARTVLVGRKLFQLQYSTAGAELTTPPPIFARVLGTVRFG
ncbi:MAG: hypothetical protein J7518_04675 [Nocardioidaceae bacterium]|nr:hypothetical protein [Nocardioidaceae bacterium]